MNQNLTGTWAVAATDYDGYPYYKHKSHELYCFYIGGFWKIQNELGKEGAFLYTSSTGTCPAAELGDWTFWDEEHGKNLVIDNELFFRKLG